MLMYRVAGTAAIFARSRGVGGDVEYGAGASSRGVVNPSFWSRRERRRVRLVAVMWDGEGAWRGLLMVGGLVWWGGVVCCRWGCCR